MLMSPEPEKLKAAELIARRIKEENLDQGQSEPHRTIEHLGALLAAKPNPQGVGAERPEPPQPRAVATPVETTVRRGWGKNPLAHWSLKPETAPTTASAV